MKTCISASLNILLLCGLANAQTTTVVSVSDQGQSANAWSGQPSISADGRFVAFYSEGTNLVANDFNNSFDVFLRDRQLGLTWRVSVDSNGQEGPDHSHRPAISADGRVVAFETMNSFDPADVGYWDIYTHRNRSGETVRVTIGLNGDSPNGSSYGATISATGQWVAFSSDASNLVADDLNSSSDIFVWDRKSREIKRISNGFSGVEANGDSSQPSISADGRFVAFQSTATNLVAGDSNARQDVFVYDCLFQTTICASLNQVGLFANGKSVDAKISQNAACVTFTSSATDLTFETLEGLSQVFLHDLNGGGTEMVSLNSRNLPARDSSYMATPSANGDYVCFTSEAKNLGHSLYSSISEVYLRNRLTQTIRRANPDGMVFHPEAMIAANGESVVYVNGENDSSEILHTASGQLRQTDSIILSGPWQHDASRPLKLSWTAAPPKEVATIYFSLNQTGRIFDGLKFDLGAPWTSVAVLATGHEGSGGAYLGRIPYSFVGMPIHFELVCRTNDSLFNSIPQTIHVY